MCVEHLRSGNQCFDWVIPDEWVVHDAYIITPDNKKICSFKKHNLHLLNYSAPINKTLNLDELQNHLYSLPNKPNAIPYVTSYYERRFGFCITHNERKNLKKGLYKVFIDTEFKKDGFLSYGELVIPSTNGSNDEILFSTYLCHPQMVNNELSGPAVWSELIKWLKTLKYRHYNYKFIILPESIGSICYIHNNLNHLKQFVKGGFILTCIGDENNYSIVLSPNENTLSDKVGLHTIKFLTKNPKIYSFLHRGSDERQFNSPLVNLGVVALCRSKFGEFYEYHTSLDDLNFVTKKGLEGGFLFAKNVVLNLEINKKYILNIVCEPNLGKCGLIDTLSLNNSDDMVKIRNFLAFCDGKRDVIDIADILNVEAYTLKDIIEILSKFKLIKEIN